MATVENAGTTICSIVAIFLSKKIKGPHSVIDDILFASIFTQTHDLPVNEYERKLLNAMVSSISTDINNEKFAISLLDAANYYREVNYRFVWNTTRTRCAMAVLSYKKTVQVKPPNKWCLRQWHN